MRLRRLLKARDELSGNVKRDRKWLLLHRSNNKQQQQQHQQQQQRRRQRGSCQSAITFQFDAKSTLIKRNNCHTCVNANIDVSNTGPRSPW